MEIFLKTENEIRAEIRRLAQADADRAGDAQTVGIIGIYRLREPGQDGLFWSLGVHDADTSKYIIAATHQVIAMGWALRRG